jgi:hypothetical protein
VDGADSDSEAAEGQVIRIGFSTSTWWVSRWIRWATRSKVSHTFLLFDGGSILGETVLEAAAVGWRVSTRKHLERGTTRILAVVDPGVDLGPAVQRALDELDEPYNFLGIVGMIWVAFGRWCGKKWSNPIRNTSSMFCSEGVSDVMQDGGVPLANGIDPQSESPEALVEFFGDKVQWLDAKARATFEARLAKARGLA